MNARESHDLRPIIGVDWSFHEIHVTTDGVSVRRLPSLDALLDELDEPHRLVAESSIESWDLERRVSVAKRLRDEGHELFVYRPIHTARVRNELGWAKGNDEDARVIFRIATEGRIHIYPLLAPDPEWAKRRTELNKEYQRLRLADDKPRLISEAERVLVPYRELSDEARSVLGNGRDYSQTLLAATYFAAQHCTSRAEFERLLGLHGSAYPSLLRSEIHHHVFRHAKRRGVEWTPFRRHVRHLYAQFKAARPRPT